MGWRASPCFGTVLILTSVSRIAHLTRSIRSRPTLCVAAVIASAGTRPRFRFFWRSRPSWARMVGAPSVSRSKRRRVGEGGGGEDESGEGAGRGERVGHGEVLSQNRLRDDLGDEEEGDEVEGGQFAEFPPPDHSEREEDEEVDEGEADDGFRGRLTGGRGYRFGRARSPCHLRGW